MVRLRPSLQCERIDHLAQLPEGAHAACGRINGVGPDDFAFDPIGGRHLAEIGRVQQRRRARRRRLAALT